MKWGDSVQVREQPDGLTMQAMAVISTDRNAA
jgi:hypothetical protein